MAEQWFPLYWGDYLRDTSDLSLAEHGAYLKLLGRHYTTEAALPADWDSLYRIAGAHTDAERQAVTSVVDKFFERQIDGLVQKRVMKEVQKRRQVKDRNTRIARDRYQTGTKDAPEPAPDEHQNGTSTSTSTSTSKATPTTTKIAPDGAGTAGDAKAGRPKDLLWEAMLGACGIPLTAAIPKSARGAYNKALADLRAIGATPESIRAHAQAFRRKWQRVSLTPTALVRRWNECVVAQDGVR